MIKALIFDFDGVIADTEYIHLLSFQHVLEEKGIILSEKDYYSKFLAYDDVTLFRKVFQEHGISIEKEAIKELVLEKKTVVEKYLERELTLFPGVYDFIVRSSGNYILAIASGALRDEISFVLKRFELNRYFSCIVSAEDVKNCKPHPEAYRLALEKINNLETLKRAISPKECVVFEDSVHGVESAKAAGMYCIAVTNTYKSDELYLADRVIDSFKGLLPEDIVNF